MGIEEKFNREKLRLVADYFQEQFPGGFDNVVLQNQIKGHSKAKVGEFAREHFPKKVFTQKNLASETNVRQIIEDMVKLISKSTMTAVFEKMKFRDTMKGMDYLDQEILAQSLGELLHKDEEKGFEMMKMILMKYKFAKWTIISSFRSYYYPNQDVFVKPTTTKGIIHNFDLVSVTYHPTPTYEFYYNYRQLILEMIQMVDPCLAPSIPAFTGFLMMSNQYIVEANQIEEQLLYS